MSITPGPREIYHSPIGPYIQVKNDEGKSILVAKHMTGVIGDARLIAAAPEMYELLKKFVYVAGFVNASIDGKYWPRVKFGRDILDKADILLRRIDGEK